MSRLPKSIPAEARAPVARFALALEQWRAFPDHDFSHERVPRLMFGLYLAEVESKQLTRSEAAALLDMDTTTTAPRHIAALEADDWIELVNYPTHDKRKDYLRPTLKLMRAVEQELVRIAREAVRFVDDFDTVRSTIGIDHDALRQVPPGEPGRSLVPSPWPSAEIGTVIPPRTPHRKA